MLLVIFLSRIKDQKYKVQFETRNAFIYKNNLDKKKKKKKSVVVSYLACELETKLLSPGR